MVTDLSALTSGINALGLSLTTTQQQQLITYLQLLDKWNQIYNLTAVRDKHAMVTHHLLDSLAVVPYITHSPILDIGSGAGLPGIPLAIALPDHKFVLIDSLHKRTRFLQHVVATLSLSNVTVITQRVEHYQAAQLFHTITARAVAPCAQLVQASVGNMAVGGHWLLLKGNVAASEYENLPGNTRFSQRISLTVPGLDKQRQLVDIVKVG